MKPRCSMCFDVGWVLDCNGAGRDEPKSLELIRCFHPECGLDEPEIASLVFKGPRSRAG